MSEVKEIDCQYTREIICPYCGYERSNSVDDFDGPSSYEDDCEECGKTFIVEPDVEITFSTHKKDANNDA